MSLYNEIIKIYPECEITAQTNLFAQGIIYLADDGNGINYIKEWHYSKPLPDGMKIGK